MYTKYKKAVVRQTFTFIAAFIASFLGAIQLLTFCADIDVFALCVVKIS